MFVSMLSAPSIMQLDADVLRFLIFQDVLGMLLYRTYVRQSCVCGDSSGGCGRAWSRGRLFCGPFQRAGNGRDAKTADLNEAKAQIEADRQEISELSTSVTQYLTQAEGLAQQLTYLKSQLAQAQRAEQERVERERERAAAEAERKQVENERKLQEQSKVLSALAPRAKES